MPTKYFLSFLLLTNIGILHTQDRPQGSDMHNQISQWIDQHISKMTPEQVQLTANFAYLLYAGALFECAVRTHIPAITTSTTMFTQKLYVNQDALYELAITQALIANLKVAAYGRQLMYETLDQAYQYLDTHEQDEEMQNVLLALESLQLHGQNILRLHAHDKTETINQDISNLCNTLKELKQFLPIATDICKNLLNDMLLSDIDDNNKTLVKIDKLSNIAQKITQQNSHTICAANRFETHITQLANTGKDLYAAYYQAIYQYMQTNNIDTQYQFLMFYPKGIIIPEFRTKILDSPKQLTDNVSKLAIINTNTNVIHKERTINA